MFIISGAQGPDHAIADHVKLHGPGVKDVGFLVPGAAAAYDRAVERGAIPHMAAVVIENDRVRMVQATIKAYGDSPIVSDTTPTIVYGLFMPAVDAISTEDLQTSIEDMHGRGIETIYVPHEYYPEARERLGDVDLDWENIERLCILVDKDDDGYLLQTFTKMMQDRPTVFFEFIERRGATGFGLTPI